MKKQLLTSLFILTSVFAFSLDNIYGSWKCEMIMDETISIKFSDTFDFIDIMPKDSHEFDTWFTSYLYFSFTDEYNTTLDTIIYDSNEDIVLFSIYDSGVGFFDGSPFTYTIKKRDSEGRAISFSLQGDDFEYFDIEETSRSKLMITGGTTDCPIFSIYVIVNDSDDKVLEIIHMAFRGIEKK